MALGRLKSQNSYQLLTVPQQTKDIPISLSRIKDHTNNMHDETQKLVEKPPVTTTTEQNNSAQNLEDKPPVTTITEQNDSAQNLEDKLPVTTTI